MQLQMDINQAAGYKSASQIARRLTEHWLSENVYCPNCVAHLKQCANNLPVQDFACPQCGEQFELKSANRRNIGHTLSDGAYHTMMERLQAADNPNFFFLGYDKTDYSVQQLVLIPKHFITPDMIKQRKPLPPTARRAGWVGCSVDLRKLPQHGKILLVDQGSVVPHEQVRSKWQSHCFLQDSLGRQKSWLVSVLRCLDRLPTPFSLQQIYKFEPLLHSQFPENRHIQAKIRQQLQILRDRGLLAFEGRGIYRKLY